MFLKNIGPELKSNTFLFVGRKVEFSLFSLRFYVMPCSQFLKNGAPSLPGLWRKYHTGSMPELWHGITVYKVQNRMIERNKFIFETQKPGCLTSLNRHC